jgi:hypothetical protein
MYSMGFSRLSCALCVNGRISEHQLAAELKPHLAIKFAQVERKIGRTVRLKQVNGVKLPRYMDEYLTAIKLPQE